MVATTTEQITSLTKRLIKDSQRLPELSGLTFVRDNRFGWDASTRVITYDPSEKEAFSYLLHEFSHAMLGHSDRSRDITLLEMERAAWDQAAILAARYDATMSEDVIEDSLDTYRDWLHARSACPTCSSTGVQITECAYQCLACQTEWRVNDARSCALRRYPLR